MQKAVVNGEKDSPTLISHRNAQGDKALGEHLWQYRDHKVTLILAVTGEAEEQIVCGICGFLMDELGDCARCRLLNQAIAGAIKQWRAGQNEMLREVEEILRDEDE